MASLAIYCRYGMYIARLFKSPHRPPLKRASWESVLESVQWELRRAQAEGDTKRIPELKEAVRIAKKRVRAKESFPGASLSTQN